MDNLDEYHPIFKAFLLTILAISLIILPVILGAIGLFLAGEGLMAVGVFIGFFCILWVGIWGVSQ